MLAYNLFLLFKIDFVCPKGANIYEYHKRKKLDRNHYLFGNNDFWILCL
jgi:hypothetical protein